MTSLVERTVFAVLFALVSGAGLRAQSIDVSLHNWTVPPYRPAESSGGITTMTDISPGVAFVAVTPCRIVDTRGGGVFVGAYGPPALAANANRPFDINSAAHCPGVPAGAQAYSLNFTAVGTAGGPGDLRAWPTGNPPVQTTSVLNWTTANVIIANATIIGAGTGGSIDVTAAGFGTHLLIDINGYFSDTLNAGNQAVIVSSVPDQGALRVENTAVAGTATAIVGTASASTGLTWGVLGVTNSSTAGSAGLRGAALNTVSPGARGVHGTTASFVNDASGIQGEDGFGPVPPRVGFGRPSAGVRGESAGSNGVMGLSRTGRGVYGARVNANGEVDTSASLGESATVGLFVFGNGTVNGDLLVVGNFSSANKFFIQPHPFDPSKQIRYVSLEGPHSEVYFRGTAQVFRGVTRIDIPEDFRHVADPGTYSTLVTPVGAMATVAVMAQGESGIVIQASRDVKVAYVVYAEREAMKNPDPIIENVDFRPAPDGELLARLPDSYRRLMIQNGTLNPDGTINMETARRLGWDKLWEKRDPPTPQITD